MSVMCTMDNADIKSIKKLKRRAEGGVSMKMKGRWIFLNKVESLEMRSIIKEGMHNAAGYQNLITLDYKDLRDILNKSKGTILIKSTSLTDLIKKANKDKHLKNSDGMIFYAIASQNFRLYDLLDIQKINAPLKAIIAIGARIIPRQKRTFFLLLSWNKLKRGNSR